MKAFLVCFLNSRNESEYLLLNELPSAWNDRIPTYNMGVLIDSVIVDPFGGDSDRFNWRIAGSDREPLEFFDYMHIEYGDCYIIEVDEDAKWLRFENWIGRYYTDDLYQEKTSVASEIQSTDCELAPPADFMAPVKDQPAEAPALTPAYLVCHKIDDKKRYVLMRELPISWTSHDTFYYHESDIIESVVPGTKYSFTSLNMSAYAYGEEYMRPGDIISCVIVGNCIDRFVRIDRYLVRCATREVTESGAEGSNIVDEVNKSVDQLLSDNVNHPSHYTSHPSGVDCIEITKHHDFCIGNAIKYLWRQGLKQDADKSAKDKQIEDLKKAIWYINKKIEMLEGE